MSGMTWTWRGARKTAEAQVDQALDEIDRLRACLDEEYEITKRLRAELRSMDNRLTRSEEYTGLLCCRDRSCGCWDGRAVIEHLQEAYDELSAEAQEVRQMWRAGVDKIDATRRCFYDEQASEYVARSFHAHYESMAPAYGYATRQASNVPWSDVPEPNRLLMVATAGHVLRDLLDMLDLGPNP